MVGLPPRPSFVPARASRAWKQHASFWAMLVTGAALIATDEISELNEGYDYAFEETVAGPAFELSPETSSVAFRIRIQSLALSPDATPFTDNVGLSVEGELTHSGVPEEARWAQARLEAVAATQQPVVDGGTGAGGNLEGAWDAGQLAGTAASAGAAAKVFTRFSESLSQVAFDGDCAELAATTPPCEAVVELSVVSGGGAETVSVQWQVHVFGRAYRAAEGDMNVDSAVAVTVERL